MTSKTRLIGVPAWQLGLIKEIKKIDGSSEAGVLAAALFVKKISMKEAPVAVGNLRNSAYVVSSSGKVDDNPDFKGADKSMMSAKHAMATSKAKAEARARKSVVGPSAYLGYSAVYALKVHENPRAGKTGGVSPRGQKYGSGLTQSGNKSTRITWARKGKWKFLEDPMKNNTRKILKIIQLRSRIK